MYAPEWAKIMGAVLLPNVGGFVNGYLFGRNTKIWYKVMFYLTKIMACNVLE